MENVNQRLLRALDRHWRVALCGPEGCASHAPEAIDVSETPIKPLSRFLLGLALRTSRMALRHEFGLVVAGSGLAAPMAWLAARWTGARLVVYLHGLDVIVPSRTYQTLWLPFIRSCDMVLVNSGNTAKLAAARGIPAGRIHVLHPGTDMPLLDPAAGQDFRARFALAQRPIVLSVGRLTRRKGLAEFVARSLPGIIHHQPGTMLVIVGEEAVDALHTAVGSERDRILAAAVDAGVESSLLFVGRCDADLLSGAFQAAQVHVFPVLDQAGDVEGFGMVALEAAAHGLRTVAFSIGGVPEAVHDPESGTLVPAADYARFTDAVVAMLERPQTDRDALLTREFAAGKDWNAFGRRLRLLLGRRDS